MTIEPSAVRFTFGTSVRTWNADDKPRKPAIAATSQDDMRRKWKQLREQEMKAQAAEKAARKAREFGVTTVHIVKDRTEKPTAMQRQILGLLKLRANVGTGRIAQLLGFDKKHAYDAMCRLAARGTVTSPPPRGGHPRLWTITQAGLDALENDRLPSIGQEVYRECP